VILWIALCVLGLVICNAYPLYLIYLHWRLSRIGWRTCPRCEWFAYPRHEGSNPVTEKTYCETCGYVSQFHGASVAGTGGTAGGSVTSWTGGVIPNRS